MSVDDSENTTAVHANAKPLLSEAPTLTTATATGEEVNERNSETAPVSSSSSAASLTEATSRMPDETPRQASLEDGAAEPPSEIPSAEEPVVYTDEDCRIATENLTPRMQQRVEAALAAGANVRMTASVVQGIPGEDTTILLQRMHIDRVQFDQSNVRRVYTAQQQQQQQPHQATLVQPHIEPTTSLQPTVQYTRFVNREIEPEPQQYQPFPPLNQPPVQHVVSHPQQVALRPYASTQHPPQAWQHWAQPQHPWQPPLSTPRQYSSQVASQELQQQELWSPPSASVQDLRSQGQAPRGSLFSKIEGSTNLHRRRRCCC